MKNHTKGDWKYTFSTPKEQSEKTGMNAGGLCHVYTETDKKIFGRPTYDTICDLLHWRDNSKNAEKLANVQLICAAPKMYEAINEVLGLLSSENPDIEAVKNKLRNSIES